MILHKGSYKIIRRFLIRDFGDQRYCADIFKVLKENETKPYQSRILYPAKLSFKTEEEIKAFPDQQKLRDSVTTRTSLQETFKGVLQVEVQEH